MDGLDTSGCIDYNLTELTPADDVDIVWVNQAKNCCYHTTLDIHSITNTDAGLEFVGSTDTTDVRHFESPLDNVRVLNTAGTDTDPVRTILGTAPTSEDIRWDMFFTLLTLDYSPAEAMDLVALRYNLEPEDWYLDVHGESPAEVHARLDDSVDELASLVETPCSLLSTPFSF